MLESETAVDDQQQALGLLAKRGWFRHSGEAMHHGSILREMSQVGDRLGRRVRGRAGALEEVVEPRHLDEAHPRSLSARYGEQRDQSCAAGLRWLRRPSRGAVRGQVGDGS